MLQYLNTVLVFSALPGMLPVGRAGKTPRRGHSWAPGEKQGAVLLPPHAAFCTAARGGGRAVLGGPGCARRAGRCSGWPGCARRAGPDDSQPRDSPDVRPVPQRSAVPGLAQCRLPLSGLSLDLLGKLGETEQGSKLAWIQLCSCTSRNSRVVFWGQWMETLHSQPGSLGFVGKTVAI